MELEPVNLLLHELELLCVSALLLLELLSHFSELFLERLQCRCFLRRCGGDAEAQGGCDSRCLN